LPDEPLLSVIVPVYQVEEYLAACLDSLLEQTYQRLEILVVDDGSTDRGPDIARSYAALDERVRVVSQPNAGLGAARNTGLTLVTGDLVTFADSDDTVPPNAYRRMVRTLQRSGSDFVVGAVVRDEGGVERMRPWVRRTHARRRFGVTVEDIPDVLINVVACTKVFRRDFLERVGLCFPERVHYEDQVPITRAYLLANAFDVIPDVVYRWRIRDDRSSITQRKTELTDLLDRSAAQREVAELLDVHASEKVRYRWYLKVVRHDLFSYLRLAAELDDAYWDLLQDRIMDVVRRAPAGLVDEVELRIRLAMWLGVHGHRDALHRLVRHEGFTRSDFPVVLRGDGVYADICLVDRLVDGLEEGDGVRPPEDLLRLRAVDLTLSPRLLALDWTVPGRLSVSCLAPLAHVDPRVHDVRTTFSLRDPLAAPLTVGAVDTDTVVVPSASANRMARRSYEDHTRSVVRGVIDLAALVAASGDRACTRWELHVVADALGESVESSLVDRVEHGSPVVARATVVDGALVTAIWSQRRGLVIEVRTVFSAVTGVTRGADGFDLDVLAVGEPVPDRVLVGSAPVPARISAPRPDRGDQVVRIHVPDTDATGARLSGRVRLAAAGERPRTVPVVPRLDPVSLTNGEACVRSTSDGMLTTAKDTPCLLVDDITGEPGVVVLTGRAHRFPGGTVALQSRHGRTRATWIHPEGERFVARLPTAGQAWCGPVGLVPAGGYRLVVEADQPVRVVAGRIFDHPAPHVPGLGWSVEVDAERGLQLRLARQDEASDSQFAQSELRRTTYRTARRRPTAAVALFESFGGVGAADGPRAVSDLLAAQGSELDLVWSVADPSMPVPPGTRAVLRETAEWYDVLGSAQLLVNNGTFPEYFTKAPGQTYVQTWHGTPLKKIGLDVPGNRISTERQRRLVAREAQSWDMLVSSSSYDTDVFRRALGYDGRILEVGRPSNDLLLGLDADRVRREVRARLGIGEGQTVLLYAPTWRDDRRAGSGWAKVGHLDHAMVTAARPDVTVLYRGHPLTARQGPMRGERVVDVTSYPDIAHLYLAADVLVTDYSSAMVDFNVTGKPVVLLAPDLASYRDRVRGLYVDLEQVAPGPIVTSTEEVLDHLDGTGWAHARERMRRMFSQHEDGSATDRLVSAVLPVAIPV
jgi:CDP-glycerol glycerophosphotransferase